MTNRKERYALVGAARAQRALAWMPQSAVLLGVLLHGHVVAQESGAVTVDVTECVKLTSPAERLACFEAGVDGVMRDRASAAEPAVSTAPEAAPVREATAPRQIAPAPRPEPARTEPARTEPARAAREEARPEPRAGTSEAAPGDVVGVIAALRETFPNIHVITLADGQVWRQTRASPYPLTEGATVRIYTVERWGGSHRLTAVGRKGFIQVERVR